MSIAAAVLVQIEVAFLLILGLALIGAGLVLAVVVVSALRRNPDRPGGNREEEERRER